MAVIGLGLIGLLVVQLARAAGCKVVGMDVNAERCRLAQRLGCDDTATSAEQLRQVTTALTNGKGADAVLITAGTSSNAPVELAGDIARDCGRVVAVGAVGLQIPRKSYYEKELSVYVSRSYGPGRYRFRLRGKGSGLSHRLCSLDGKSQHAGFSAADSRRTSQRSRSDYAPISDRTSQRKATS